MKTELLADLLSVLDGINESTHLALETLNKNAETTRMLINELVNGVEENSDIPFVQEGINNIKKYIDTTDSIDLVAEEIAKKIGETSIDHGFKTVSIDFDMSKYDPDEVMKLVNKKLAEANKPPKKEEQKGIISDDFNFEDPLA